MKTYLLLSVFILVLAGCDRNSAAELSEKEQAHLEKLGLLAENETVLLSSFSNSVRRGGSFFTEDKIVTYWIDPYDRDAKSYKRSTPYGEIANISIRYAPDWSYAHLISLHLIDGSTVPAYLYADAAFAEQFFNGLLAEWQASQ